MLYYSLYYLGCRVNQSEVENFEDRLLELGLRPSLDGKADIIIFNTCAVTNKAEKESYRLIRRVFKENPNSKLFITGCIVPLNKVLIDQVKNRIINNDSNLEKFKDNIFIISSLNKHKLIDILKEKLLENNLENYQENNLNNDNLVNLRFKYNIKVQDGCNHFCSFCIIPYTRGRSRSKPINQVINEIQNIKNNLNLVSKKLNNESIGVEIDLVGICLGDYGLDISTNLTNLLKEIAKVIKDTNIIIRLSSLDLATIDDELIEVVYNTPNIAKYFHLPLQSGSDEILKLMKRNYTVNQYLEAINKIKQIPDVGITTDIIVGFPYEQDYHFEQTLQVVDYVKYHRIHIFPFSFRPYTYAYNKFRHIKIDIDKIKERERILTQRSLNNSYEFIKYNLGKVFRVLIEPNSLGYTHNFIRVKTDVQTNIPIIKEIKIEGIYEQKNNFYIAKGSEVKIDKTKEYKKEIFV
jgi:threonylcarbamoyladenosine tRNA methylthiotransferase MtaB